MRLTKSNIQKILNNNEGYTSKTSFKSKNNSYTRNYLIQAGKLIIREVGKTCWSDSRYDKTWEANEEETHRFLYNNKRELSE